MNAQQSTPTPKPWTPKQTKKATREEIERMLATDDRAVTRGLLAIYARQTSDEQKAKDVKANNGVGFTVHDAHFLTALAQQYLERGRLSAKQMDWLRKLMHKYAGQLTKIALDKHGLAGKGEVQ